MFNTLEEAINFQKNKDDGGVPLFRYEAVEVRNSDPVAFEDVVMVKIINKGDPKSIMDRPKRPEDEKRWPNHWEAFVKGDDVPIDGIPLKEFPALTPADIATCQRYHIVTVEDLANYPDVQLKNLGNRATSLKKQAKQFVQYRSGDTSKLLARIEELEKKLGNNTGDNPKRGSGNGVSKPSNASGKQQPGRKNATGTRKKIRKKTS